MSDLEMLRHDEPTHVSDDYPRSSLRRRYDDPLDDDHRTNVWLRRLQVGASIVTVAIVIVLLSIIASKVSRPNDQDNDGTSGSSTNGDDSGSTTSAFDSAIAGLTKAEGFLTLYSEGAGGDRLLVEVPEVHLDAHFLVTALFEHGDGVNTKLHMPADETNYDVFYFTLAPGGHALDLVQLQLDLRNPDDQGMEYVVEHGAWTGYLQSMPILAHNPDGGGILIDATSWALRHGFFNSDMSSVVFSDKGIAPRFESLHAFPQNLEVVATFHVRESGADNPIPVAIHYSIALLPAEPMKGRTADDRVGFFNTAFTDLGFDKTHAGKARKEADHVDKLVTLVNRWRLEKKNPQAAVSDPVKPITFYIDPSVPEKWRGALKRGVEDWKPAFEAAGFSNAIRAVLPGDTTSWPDDYSAGDIRYSTISWAIYTKSTYALGPSVVDPRSGEILNADIVFTHGWLHSWLRSFERYSIRDTFSGKEEGAKPKSLEPSRGAKVMMRASAKTRASSPEESQRHAHKSSPHFHHRHCQHDRIKDDLSPSLFALSYTLNAKRREAEAGEVQVTSTNSGVPDSILENGLASVVRHEVGHTIGLRHNFKGSTAIPFDQLKNVTFTREHGITSSVMDYLPVAVLSNDDTVEGDYFDNAIGMYDKWAIEYGYTPVENEQLGVQHADLKAIAQRVNTGELIFATDEDVPRSSGGDPYTSVFDMSSEPMDFWEDRFKLVRKIHNTIMDRSVAQHDPWFNLYNAYSTLRRAVELAGAYSAKFFGGNVFTKAHRGDPHGPAQPSTPPSRAQQVRALNLITTIISDDSLFVPNDTESFMVKRTGWCSSVSQDCLGLGAVNLVEEMANTRISVLDSVFTDAHVKGMISHEYMGADTLPLTLLLEGITEVIFGAEGTTTFPEFTRSSLTPVQHYWLGKLDELRRREDIAAAYAHKSFSAALGRINAAAGNPDAATTGHLLKLVAQRLDAAFKGTA